MNDASSADRAFGWLRDDVVADRSIPRDHAAISHLREAMKGLTTTQQSGRVVEVLGTLVKAVGVDAEVGELCELRTPGGRTLGAEVIGFSGAAAILTPFGDIAGLSNRTDVVAMRRTWKLPTGDALLGRVLDGFGTPIDGRGPIRGDRLDPVSAEPPDPMTRRAVDDVFETRVRALDALITIGKGQRMGLFAPVGAGKTTLVGMLARGADVDVNVIALIGERGREVRDFLEHVLGEDGLKRSVVLVATSDRPAVERAKCAEVATLIAESFRRRGQDTLLLVDSITRYARALREIGLASGEVPTRRGFPPSVFAALPRLLERAGNDAFGTMTAFYTLLVEGDEDSDPIAEEVRSLLDGHVNLSRALAQSHHFPAIDVLGSLSRVMPALVSAEHLQATATVRGWLAKHRDLELLLQMGEYRPGADALADEAIGAMPALHDFLRQATRDRFDYPGTVASLLGLMRRRHG